MTQERKVRFLHFRRKVTGADGTTQIDSRGGITFAYVEGDGHITYAGAKCHEKDNFSKHQGRVKAKGRLNSPAYAHDFPGDEKVFTAYVENAMKQAGLERKFNGKRKPKFVCGNAVETDGPLIQN